MTVLLTLLGTALIVVVLRDIFHTLFHPSGSGMVSGRAAHYLWRTSRSAASHWPQLLSLAGPLTLILIITGWTLVLTIGWALIYWPHLSDAFLMSTGLDPAQNDGFLDAIYLSAVTLATLGFGEITPQSTWLRMIVPLEALIGFGLMTASISWILSVYPVLSRRRHLAREIALMQRTGQWQGTRPADATPEAFQGILLSLAEQVIAVRGDLAQFPITYYFHPSDRDSSLAVSLPEITSLARSASRHGSATVRFQANLLLQAIQDLASYVGEVFLDRRDGDLEELLATYAKDHMHRDV